jgi:hypothetical protein
MGNAGAVGILTLLPARGWREAGGRSPTTWGRRTANRRRPEAEEHHARGEEGTTREARRRCATRWRSPAGRPAVGAESGAAGWAVGHAAADGAAAVAGVASGTGARPGGATLKVPVTHGRHARVLRCSAEIDVMGAGVVFADRTAVRNPSGRQQHAIRPLTPRSRRAGRLGS